MEILPSQYLPDKHIETKVSDCEGCGSDLVQPLEWYSVLDANGEEKSWVVDVRCPNCHGCCRHLNVSPGAAHDFDEAHDDASIKLYEIQAQLETSDAPIDKLVGMILGDLQTS